MTQFYDGSAGAQLLAPDEPSRESIYTPTPWEAQPYDEDEPGVFIVGCPLGGLVAMAGMWPTELDAKDATRATANAAFIVEAVNGWNDINLLRLRLAELEGK